MVARITRILEKRIATERQGAAANFELGLDPRCHTEHVLQVVGQPVPSSAARIKLSEAIRFVSASGGTLPDEVGHGFAELTVVERAVVAGLGVANGAVAREVAPTPLAFTLLVCGAVRSLPQEKDACALRSTVVPVGAPTAIPAIVFFFTPLGPFVRRWEVR